MGRKLLSHLMIPVSLFAIGTLGYRIIEGDHWSILDGLYMTTITLTTIGYGETHPLSPPGRIFTIFLSLSGIFVLAYAASELIRTIVSGEIRTVLGRNRMKQSLEEISEHIIICGYGRMGQLVHAEFEMLKMPHVIIESDASRLIDFESEYGIPLAGNATADEILRQAGIHRARTVICLTSSDADNLYIALSSRLLKDDIYLIARAESEAAMLKLRRVGAQRIISPSAIGGHRVALAICKPNVLDFLELALHRENVSLQIEECEVHPDSSVCGKTLRDSPIRTETEVIIVAIKSNDVMTTSPTGDYVLTAGCILVSIGHQDQLKKLKELVECTPRETRG